MHSVSTQTYNADDLTDIIESFYIENPVIANRRGYRKSLSSFFNSCGVYTSMNLIGNECQSKT